MKAESTTESERQENYLDGVFRSGHPRIQAELVDSEEGRSTLLAYVSEKLSVVTELVHELGREGAFGQHLRSIVRVELPYWFHRALCIAFRNAGSKPEALSQRSSVWAWRAFKRHQESDFDDWHYPGAQALEELERAVEEILQVATDENVSFMRRGSRPGNALPDGLRRTEAGGPDDGLPLGTHRGSRKACVTDASPWQDRVLGMIVGTGQDLSTAEIARLAGVSRSTLYRNERVKKALKLRPRKNGIQPQRLGRLVDSLGVRDDVEV